jgi:hypothetical protein
MTNADPTRSNIPIPDPTLLTTAALDREISHLRELVMTEHQADVRSLKDAEAQHKRTHEAEERLRDTQHDALLQQLASLKELLKEALAARDAALASALATSKEATGKAEDALAKQLDAINKRSEVELGALRDALGDLKTNAGTTGGRIAGKEYVWGVVIVLAALMLSVIGIIFTR